MPLLNTMQRSTTKKRKMMKFKKRPIIIEAEQWFPGKVVQGVYFLHPQESRNGLPSYSHWVDTLEGRLAVSPGDWIITGIKGNQYPCKPDIFEATYEKVEAKEGSKEE